MSAGQNNYTYNVYNDAAYVYNQAADNTPVQVRNSDIMDIEDSNIDMTFYTGTSDLDLDVPIDSTGIEFDEDFYNISGDIDAPIDSTGIEFDEDFHNISDNSFLDSDFHDGGHIMRPSHPAPGTGFAPLSFSSNHFIGAPQATNYPPGMHANYLPEPAGPSYLLRPTSYCVLLEIAFEARRRTIKPFEKDILRRKAAEMDADGKITNQSGMNQADWAIRRAVLDEIHIYQHGYSNPMYNPNIRPALPPSLAGQINPTQTFVPGNPTTSARSTSTETHNALAHPYLGEDIDAEGETDDEQMIDLSQVHDQNINAEGETDDGQMMDLDVSDQQMADIDASLDQQMVDVNVSLDQHMTDADETHDEQMMDLDETDDQDTTDTSSMSSMSSTSSTPSPAPTTTRPRANNPTTKPRPTTAQKQPKRKAAEIEDTTTTTSKPKRKATAPATSPRQTRGMTRRAAEATTDVPKPTRKATAPVPEPRQTRAVGRRTAEPSMGEPRQTRAAARREAESSIGERVAARRQRRTD